MTIRWGTPFLRASSVVVFFLLPSGAAIAAEHVVCSGSSTTTTCRIDEPRVNQAVTSYAQITFKAGDRVTVSAGGCVQTGGHGNTWKRYVNPSGPNSDRLYHGLIQIPGVHSDLVHIAGVVNAPVSVPATVKPNAILRLGYEDDGYGDNSYSDHDDGTEDQCKGVGAAFVVLRIDHSSITPPPSTAPFDLVFTQVDANGFPLNPKWAFQSTGGLPDADTQCFNLPGIFSNPLCTTQSPSIDGPSGWNAAWCGVGAQHSINGHVNWMPATWQGTVSWDGHSSPGTDDDYNVNVVPPNQEGLTVSSEGRIHCEFDSDETIDHFETAWWRSFHSAVDNGDSSAKAIIDGHFAIIVGLAGLDCEHGCATELHPVYGLAVHLNDNPQDDTWGIFVRNWGDEGYCSQDGHLLHANRIAFQLPRPGATAVAVNIATSFLTNNADTSGPGVTVVPGQGAIVEFGLPDPEQGARINGELHLQWTVKAGSPTHATIAGSALSHTTASTIKVGTLHGTVSTVTKAPPVETERRLVTLEQGLTADQRHAVAAKLARPVTFDQVKPKALTAPLPRKPGKPAVTAKLDPVKADKDRLRAQALCDAFGGKMPDQPNACASVPR